MKRIILTPMVGYQPECWPKPPTQMGENYSEREFHLRGAHWWMALAQRKAQANPTLEATAAAAQWSANLRERMNKLRKPGQSWAIIPKTLLALVALVMATTLINAAGTVEARPPSPALLVGENFLDAVAMVESSGNAKAIGDGGKATGAWQLHQAARIDARSYLGRAGTDRELAKAYFQWIQARFVKRYGKQPTYAELYQAYNRGFGNAAKDGFDLNKAPVITQRACKRLQGLLK
jgi:hypothetical protein